jgi:phosphoglycerate dehydrogenase-like enzyme
MAYPTSFSRRDVLSTAGLAVAAIALPGVARGAETAKAPAPRLPIVIWDREGISDESMQQIKALSPDIRVEKEPTADASVVFGGLGRDAFEKTKKLQWVQFGAAGVESMMYPEFIESDVVLTNAQGCYAPAIAEHAFGLLFALTRGIAYHAKARKWGYEKWPIELRGMTIGIIGLGGIGREIARRAKAMDMKVLAVDAEPMYGERFAMVDEVALVDDGLEPMLARSDVVAMCAPITNRSRGMIAEKQFAAIKKGCYYINVSRGKTTKTDALVAALKSGQLAGAGLDVTDPEPLPDGHELWDMENVIITSHIAGRSQFSKGRVQKMFVENVKRWAAGLPLLNVVDKHKGY